MLRLASDEDVHGDIIRALRLREPTLDLVRVQEVGLRQTPDSRILEWTAAEGRILLSADLTTMIGSARSRAAAGQPMPGLLALTQNVSTDRVLTDILLVATCYTEEVMKALVVEFIPL
jgi:hypothetical protein